MAESVLGVKTRPGGIFDANMELTDSNAVVASAAGLVDSAANYLDVGTGLFKGKAIIDVTALEVASTDEIYDIIIQGSNTTAFTAAGICELASLNLSAVAVKRSDCNKADAVGRYKLYFDNENNGTYYRYIRAYTVVAGTIDTTGITFSSYVVPM